MAWTAPLTFVTNQEINSSHYNTYMRDNFMDLAPQKVTTAGQYLVSEGFNQIAARTAKTAIVTTSQTTASTSYTNLSTAGPDVQVTHGQAILVFIGARMANNGPNLQCRMSLESNSGSASVSASDKRCVKTDGSDANQPSAYTSMSLIGDLNPGTTTFRAKYRVGGGTGTFALRQMCIIPL